MDFPQKLLEEETSQILKRYKSTANQVYEIFVEVFSKKQSLLTKINEAYPEEDVTRWSDYKSAIKEIRKRVYYELRQYHQHSEKESTFTQKLDDMIKDGTTLAASSNLIHKLLSTHISTKERVSDLDNFYSTIRNFTERPDFVLDLGCGINPLSYPFYMPHPPSHYFAIDKDETSIELLKIFSNLWSPLQAKTENLETIRWQTFGTPDLVFMLKLVPVVNRHQKSTLNHLAQCPGKVIVITGSSTAMTKNQNIRHREDRVLRDFIEQSNRKIVGELEISSEFGYIIQ